LPCRKTNPCRWFPCYQTSSYVDLDYSKIACCFLSRHSRYFPVVFGRFVL
jgi:hypothetical protein